MSLLTTGTRLALGVSVLALTLLAVCGCGEQGRNRFEISDGMIHDNKTNLRWEANLRPGAISWNDATAYCSEQGLRLPAQYELEEWLDVEADDCYSACSHRTTVTGVNEDPGYVWSSTESETDTSFAVVCFTSAYGDSFSNPIGGCGCRVDFTLRDRTSSACPVKDAKTILKAPGETAPMRVWCVE